MGGTDAGGFTPTILDLLARTGLPLQVTAVTTGPAVVAPGRPAGKLDVTLVPPAEDVAALMVGHDLVLSAAGTSMAELFCLGVPTVLVCVADNQRPGYQRALDAGAAVGIDPADAGRAVDLLRRVAGDAELRRTLSDTASRLVDGLGAWRIVRTWEQLTTRSEARPFEAGQVLLRPATAADADLLLEWRNDPETRSASRHAGSVDPAAHRRWLAESLNRPDRILLVGADHAGAVGIVRWDRDSEEEWEVSITVAPHRRGGRLALPLLDAGERELHRRQPAATTLLASVHAGNSASQRLFVSAGYTPDLPPDSHGFLRLLKQRLF
jgi:RimJ/RimL family protein N-acetyltransferase